MLESRLMSTIRKETRLVLRAGLILPAAEMGVEGYHWIWTHDACEALVG